MMPQLSCAACRERLAPYVAHQLDAADRAAVEQHLAGCADCTRELAQWEAIAGAFQEADRRVPLNMHAAAIWDSLEARIVDSSNSHHAKGTLSMAIETPHETTPDRHDTSLGQNRRGPDISRRTFPLVAVALLVVIAAGLFWSETRKSGTSVVAGNNTSPPTLSSGPVVIGTDHSVYSPTDSIQVTIKNTLAQTISFQDISPCPPLSLQQENAGNWSDAASGVCRIPVPLQPPFTIAEGKTLTLTIKPINATAGYGYVILPGTYRLELYYDMTDGESASATTADSATLIVQGTLSPATVEPSPTSEAQPTPLPGDPGSASNNGCLSQQDPGVLPATDIVVTETGLPGTEPSSDGTNKVQIQVGQTIQIRLSATDQWDSPLIENSGILSGHTPLGGYSGVLTACIWRYTATATGVAKISFSGSPICSASQPACPAIALIANYEITVGNA